MKFEHEFRVVWHPSRVQSQPYDDPVVCATLRPPATFLQPFGLPEVSQLYDYRLNGFRLNLAFRGTWLKPGVNETRRTGRRELVLGKP